MAQTSFDADEKTTESLERLKKIYGVTTNAAVLKRALAIALVASKHADEDNNILLLSKEKEDGTETRILIPQRL